MILNYFNKISKTAILSAFAAVSLTGQPVAAAPGDAPQVPATSYVTVSTLKDLNRALREVRRPTSILVAPGDYSGLSIRGLTVPEGTVLKSAIDGRPASFDGLFIDSVRGLTVENIVINPSAKGSAAGRYGALVVNSKNVKLDGLRIVGPGRRIDTSFFSGIMLRRSSDVTFARSYVANFRHGLTLLDLSNSLIEANEFEGLQTDGIRGGGIQNTSIRANVITDFQPSATDHPDGIQIWSTNQAKPGRGITISDNIVIRGKGGPTQGIFVRDTKSKLPFESLTIDGNLVIGGRYNGISVGSATGVKVTNNMVIPRSDQKSWIRLEQTRDALVANNYAGTYVFRNNREKLRSRNNTQISANDRNLAPVISRWARQKASFSTYRGAVLQRLMKYGY